jgi:hypothetical protein
MTDTAPCRAGDRLDDWLRAGSKSAGQLAPSVDCLAACTAAALTPSRADAISVATVHPRAANARIRVLPGSELQPPLSMMVTARDGAKQLWLRRRCGRVRRLNRPFAHTATRTLCGCQLIKVSLNLIARNTRNSGLTTGPMNPRCGDPRDAT